MRLVDQNGRGPGRQPLLNTDRIRHFNGHIAEPCIVVKTDLLPGDRAIIPVSNHAMAHHRTPGKFDGGILLFNVKLCDEGGLRDLCKDSTVRGEEGAGLSMQAKYVVENLDDENRMSG
jgi:hypothetical protein